jgi:hypothetical protein
MSITDPTWDELSAEKPWFDDEVVSAAMSSCSSRWRAHWKVGPTLIGSKGDENHLRGRHRSRNWTRNSIYCTDRGYGDTDSRDHDAPASFGNYLRAFDIDGMAEAERWAFNHRLDIAVRTGLLPCVAEWFGTFDGVSVVGWYQGHASSSDDSHLGHTHIGIWTNFCENQAQLDLLCNIILGELDVDEKTIAAAVWAQKISSQAFNLDQPAADWLKAGEAAKREVVKLTAQVQTQTAALQAQATALQAQAVQIAALATAVETLGGTVTATYDVTATLTPRPPV